MSAYLFITDIVHIVKASKNNLLTYINRRHDKMKLKQNSFKTVSTVFETVLFQFHFVVRTVPLIYQWQLAVWFSG